jgi:uncharacterized protein YcfJ
MNKRILNGLTVLVLGVVATSAGAGERDSHGWGHDHEYDRGRGYAQVLHVEPIFERVRYSVPVEHCWNEQVAYRSGPNGGAIIGGVLGAAVGSNIGHGDDRPATTIAGAVIGAVIGNEVSRDRDDRRVRYENVRRCETRYEERWDRHLVAYRVNYVYRGRHDVVRLAYDPGRRVRLDDVRRRG